MAKDKKNTIGKNDAVAKSEANANASGAPAPVAAPLAAPGPGPAGPVAGQQPLNKVNKDAGKDKSKGKNDKGKDKDKKKDDKGKGKEKSKKKKWLKPKYLTGETAKKEYLRRFMKALKPIKIFAQLFGQFPWSYEKQKEGKGTYIFRYASFHLGSIYFAALSLLCAHALLVGGWNFLIIIMDTYETAPTVDMKEQRWFVKSLLHRHITWIISFMAAIIEASAAYVTIYRLRFYIPTVLTFYTRLIRALHMDIAKGAYWATIKLIGLYVGTTLMIIALGCSRLASVTVGAPTFFGILMCRTYMIKIDGEWITVNGKKRLMVQLVGAVTIFFIFTASKIQMIMFVFHCKLMKNAFAVWNGRAYTALMKGGDYFVTEEGKITFELLYKDHCVLLDMMEAVNRMCKGVMEMYYAGQAATVFFEVYFFIRTARYGSNKEKAVEDGGQFFIRPWDWLPGLLLCTQSVFFAIYTANVAADVGREAMAGLAIVRRKDMLNRRTDTELLFHMSTQSSFNSFRRFDIYGGGYQYINTDWLVSFVNNVAGYFIILYQFQPTMDRTTTEEEVYQRETLGKFLTDLERLEPDHQRYKPPQSANRIG